MLRFDKAAWYLHSWVFPTLVSEVLCKPELFSKIKPVLHFYEDGSPHGRTGKNPQKWEHTNFKGQEKWPATWELNLPSVLVMTVLC